MGIIKRVTFIVFILVFLVCLLYGQAPEEFYCGQSAAGLEDGTSWANQWACSDVFASSATAYWASTDTVGKIDADDTLYIDGGTSGETYNIATAYIKYSGSSGHPITIQSGARSSYPTNHDGLVTFNGSLYGIIYCQGDYITIDGNDGEGNQNIKIIGTATGILSTKPNGVFTYLNIYHVGDAENESGISIQLSGADVPDDLEISHSTIDLAYQDAIHFSGGTATNGGFDRIKIHDNNLINVSDDGVECDFAGVSFYNNVVGPRALPGELTGHVGHPDCISLGLSDNKIYNNVFKNWYVAGDTNGNNGLQIIYAPYNDVYNASWDPENLYVYNNLIYEDSDTGSDIIRPIAISVWRYAATSSLSNYIVANNTIVGYLGASEFLSAEGSPETLTDLDHGDLTNVMFVNNVHIGTNSSSGYFLYLGDGEAEDWTIGSVGSGADIISDHNDVYDFGSGNIISLAGTGITWANWVSGSYGDDNSITTNPNLDGEYKPQDSSLDIGVDLSAYYTTDKDGTTRTSWTLGAYEYDGTPTYLNGTINGSTVSLTFSGDLDNTAFANLGDTDLICNGTTTGASYLESCSENAGVVSCTADATFVYGETVTLSTDVGFTGDELCNGESDCIESLSGEVVVNNTPAPAEAPGAPQWGSGTAPTWSSTGTAPTWATE